MTTKTKTTTVEDLRQANQEANRRVRELAAEARDLPARIQEAAKADARAKAQAARAGEDLSTATVSELPRLRERQADLPVLLWGARVGRLEASLELQRAELTETLESQHEALQEREATELEYQRAKAAWEQAVSRHEGLAYRGQNLQGAMKTTERELAALEAEGPPPS